MRPTILFVDDEPELLRGLALALRREPFDVAIAASAQEALGILATRAVDVVVADECMPGTRGTELLVRVREEYPEVVRLVLSGFANVRSTLDAINRAQVQRFLVKPCPLEELRDSLREAVAAGEERRSVRTLHAQQAAARADAALLEQVCASAWMAFQPVVTAPGALGFGYEALLRFDQPAGVGPQDVFCLAERLGRVLDLERVVRQRVAERLPSAPEGSTILVNLHPRSLGDPLLCSAQDPLHPWRDRIVLEITERDSLEDVEGLGERLAVLRGLGYRIAIDDLGAGYAGLTSFATVRPDFAKFDRQLILDIHRSDTKAKLVSSLTRLCRELGIYTIAEGVETQEERDAVRRLGCDFIQGYYYARPARDFRVVAPAPDEECFA